jgi:hypothetical protein
MTMSFVNWIVAGIGDIGRNCVIPAIQAEPRSRLYGFATRTLTKAAAYPGASGLPRRAGRLGGLDHRAGSFGAGGFDARQALLTALPGVFLTSLKRSWFRFIS